MPYSALNSNYWRLNFENPSIGSRVMWRQHYDIHTDRQTDIHTYRQTEPNYYIDNICFTSARSGRIEQFTNHKIVYKDEFNPYHIRK